MTKARVIMAGTAEPARRASAAAAIAVTAVLAIPGSGLRAQQVAAYQVPAQALSLQDLLKIKISTASLRPQEVREAPATIYVVTEEDFRKYGYRDLKDVLRNLPGIDYVWPGSHLYGGQRGFSSFWELTKLLINGREANAMTGDAAFIVNQFNLTGVKRVEVVQGPASVLYGPEAFSGVINIVTKDAENSGEESEVAGFAGGGDKGSRDGNAAFYTVAKRGTLALSVGGYAEGGHGPDYTGFLESSRYDASDVGVRTYLLEHGYPYRNDLRNQKFSADLIYTPTDRVQLKAGALYVESEQGAGIEAYQIAFANEQTTLEQLHFNASGEYRFAHAPVKATLSLHHMDEDFLNRFQSTDTAGAFPPYLAAFNFEGTRLDVVNLQADYFPAGIDNYFLAGVGMRDTRVGEPATTGLSPRDTMPGQVSSMVGRSIYPPTGAFANLRSVFHQTRLYFYAQDQQSLWKKNIQITAGMRYDSNSAYGGIWNFRGGILLRPFPNYAVRGLFGQGFREPTVVHLINADIKPARMDFWETSLLFTPVRHLSGQIAYYQNLASDLIVVAPAPGSPGGVLPQNAGHKEVGGVESLIRYQVGPLSGDLWHAYEYSIDGQPLLGSPETKLGFGADYAFLGHLSLGLRGKYTSPARGLGFDSGRSLIDITVPAYFSLDANMLAQDVEFGGVDWDFSFSVFNLLDRENFYVNTLGPNASRYLAEGREFFGKVAVRF